MEQIIFSWREGDKILETRLHQEFQIATKMMREVPEQEEEEITIDLKDRTLGFSEQLKAYLESEDKKSIGERRIGGFEAEGYRVNVTDVPDLTSGILTVTLWQDKKMGFPLEITMEGEDGVLGRMRYANLVLNEDLPEHLFEVGDLKGWTVHDYTQMIEDFTHKYLKPEVNLRVVPTGGEVPLVTEEDVVTVRFVSGHFDENGNLEWSISLIIKPRTADRLEAYVNKNFSHQLFIDFNGKTNIESRFYEVVTGRTLTIPVHSLNMTPREFEEKYLFTPKNRQVGAKPINETLTEVIFRIEFSKDDSAETTDDSVNQDKIDIFLETLNLWFDEPGVEEILWRDGNLLVFRIEVSDLTGIDIYWVRGAVEKYLDLEPPSFEFLIVAPEAYEPGYDKPDLKEKTKELIEYLKKKEATDGGWSINADLSSLAFNDVVNGNDVRYKWLPLSQESLIKYGLSFNKIYTIDEAIKSHRSEYVKSDSKLISTIFRLVQVYQKPEWRFTNKDIAAFSDDRDQEGSPVVSFELRTDRKQDFIDFTKNHIKRRMALVLNGLVISDPTINCELPGAGYIAGGGMMGFSESQQKKLLAQLKRAQSGLRVSKYEFIESK